MTDSSASPKILLVKLSSLGDVLHNLPIVWDIRERLPNAQIDWVVEEGYVDLLKPLLSREGFRGIDHIVPFGLRRWKKSFLHASSWREFCSFRSALQSVTYDVIIETQGLLKSALVCALAKKHPDTIVTGLANATMFSGYESMARAFYNQSVQVPVKCHAVDRSRYVACLALDWPLMTRLETVQFYPPQSLLVSEHRQMRLLQKPYVLFFHATARAAKRWANQHWTSLGQSLAQEGYQVVLPWGSLAEKQISEVLAREILGSIVPAAFSLQEAFPLISNAALIVGVDTGLTHLAAALKKPTVEMYCDSPRWKTEGYWSQCIRNVGDIQEPPSPQEVLEAGLDLLVNAK
jgi:heptosyltransferase-1